MVNRFDRIAFKMNSSEGTDDLQWGNYSLEPNALQNVPLEVLFTGEWNNYSHIMNFTIQNLTDLIVKARRNMQRDALPILTTITVFYSIIFIAGVLGNLITCIVISRNKSMHTATNYYLFNLAISDLILLLSGMPPDLFNIWYPFSYPFSDAVCILEGILSETAANATVLTITAFTVERYIAICHPFRQHTMSKLSRAIKFILAIWLTAFILGMPQAIQFGVIDEKGGTICSVKDDYIGHVFAVSGFVFFVGPMTAICVLYVLIGVKLKKSKLLQGVKRKSCDLNRGISAQTRVIRMLIAVAVAFFLCWAPFHAQRLMAVYGSTVDYTSALFDKVYTVLTYTSGVLYFLSTCINPLLYNIMSYKFRDAFKLTLAKHFGLSNKYQISNHNYSALARQNGSIRLNATVNSRPSTYNIHQFQKRESDLSLQDIARVRAHRLRCVSVSSQSTLLTSLSKNDVFANNPVQKSDNQCYPEDHTEIDAHQLQRLPNFRKTRESLRMPCTETQIKQIETRAEDTINTPRPNISEMATTVKDIDNHNVNISILETNKDNNNRNFTGALKSDNLPTLHKRTALESLSAKLRRGTRKTLLRKPANGVNMSSLPETVNTSPK